MKIHLEISIPPIYLLCLIIIHLSTSQLTVTVNHTYRINKMDYFSEKVMLRDNMKSIKCYNNVSGSVDL